MSLDETLHSCRNQISFKQYNSSKPHKYGLPLKSINSVKYPFTFRSVVYSGKPLELPAPYYIPGITSILQALLTWLSNSVDLQYRNFTIDRLYSSYELLNRCFTDILLLFVPCEITKKCLPNELKLINNRDNKSYKYFFNYNDTKFSLYFYVKHLK